MQAPGPDSNLSRRASQAETSNAIQAVEPEDLFEAPAQATEEAEQALARPELQVAQYSQQLTSTEQEMSPWRTQADQRRAREEHRCLQAQLDNCNRRLQAALPRNDRLVKENVGLQDQVNLLEHKLHSQQQQQQQVAMQQLAESHRQVAAEQARNDELQKQLSVLTQHFRDEDQKKSGSCTLSIAFDSRQRQEQYMEAVRDLIQPVEDRYVLNVETLQTPKPCNFLLYVTYSSSHRLVNFDRAAFEQFKQSCSTGQLCTLSHACCLMTCICTVVFH